MRIGIGLIVGLIVFGAATVRADPDAPRTDAQICASDNPNDDATIQACARKDAAAAAALSEGSDAQPAHQSAVGPPASTVASSGYSMFERGKADRQHWEEWFKAQSGDTYAGAAFWASHRSLSHHQTCAAGGGSDASAEWSGGCQTAQQMLAGSDKLRKRSREYRRGWNAVAYDDTAPAPSPVSQPAGEQPGSGAAVFWVILAAVGIFFVLARIGKANSKKPASPSSGSSDQRRAARITTTPARQQIRYPTTQQFGRPVDANQLRREGDKAWRRAGEIVQVGDITIGRGLIYVGAVLRTGAGSTENCLINPALDASPVGADDPDRHLTYWPAFGSLPPATRRAYLQWLATDRSDPNTNVGYVFLYFYGLERRLLLDRSDVDRDVIVAEIERLQGIYGANRSFRSYSERALDAAKALSGSVGQSEPSFQREGYELPLGLRIELGRFVANHLPIPADWILSWVMSDPQLYVRTPATRDLTLFREVFALRWERVKPGGVTFSEAQVTRFPKLKGTYRAASNTFNATLAINDNFPDVSGARQVIDKAHKVALECCEELDAYSRLIGRRPDLKGSIAAGSLAPSDSRTACLARDTLTGLISRPMPPTAGEIVGLLEGAPAPDKVSPGQWRKTAEALSRLDVGIAPDPDLTLTRISPDTSALLYPLPSGSNAVSDLMTAAALVLQIGALVATADGLVSDDEREELRHAALVPSLDQRQQARLSAQTEWLTRTSARPADLKSRLAGVSPEVRAWIVDVALDVAKRDGRIVVAEVKQLEKVFDWLGLPSTKLYSALQDDEPIEVAGAVAPPAGEAVSPPARARRLDKDRIATITRESAVSAQLLQTVFGEDDEPAEANGATALAADVNEDAMFAGLSPSMTAFAHAVCDRDAWTRSELEAVAAAHNVMLDGALERLNDWAFDRWDDVLVEDDQSVLRVNHQHLTQTMDA